MGDRDRLTIWIFLLFQALYALTSSGNAFRVPDEFEVYYQAEHLVDAGDLSVPQAVATGRFFGRYGVDGKPYAPYGPLAAILALPHHVLGRAVVALADIPRDNVTWTFVVSGLTMLTTSTAAALAVTGFYRAATLIGASRSAALVLSMLLGGASVLWTYGTSLYSEAWQAAAFVWAAVCLLKRKVIPASLLLAAAVLTKVTSIVFVPGFFVAVIAAEAAALKARIQSILVLALGVLVAVAIHLAWNDARFGDPFEFGYNWAETVPVLPARAFLLSDLARGLAVLLLSPGKSILLWAPVVLFSLTRIRTCPRPILLGVATSGICGLVFYAAYLFPEGGYAHGPRHLVPIVPLLVLPAAAPGPAWRREWILAAAAVGIVIALLSVSVSFLQDQALGSDFAEFGYYERIDPLPGRAWNRYRLDYVPFAKTVSSEQWPASSQVGLGLDFFPLHLMRARAAIAEARVVPLWLPAGLVVLWCGLWSLAAVKLWEARKRA